MKRVMLALLALGAATTMALASSRPDGATITVTGSTNTAGYQIKVWSDGRAQSIVGRNGTPTPFTVASERVRGLLASL